jgi:hypothetical protein
MTIKAPPVATTGKPPVNLSALDPVTRAFIELGGKIPSSQKEVK